MAPREPETPVRSALIEEITVEAVSNDEKLWAFRQASRNGGYLTWPHDSHMPDIRAGLRVRIEVAPPRRNGRPNGLSNVKRCTDFFRAGGNLSPHTHRLTPVNH